MTGTYASLQKSMQTKLFAGFLQKRSKIYHPDAPGTKK